MPTVNLTKREVDAAQPGSVRYELFDSKLKGFGLRVTPSGEKTWVVVYRSGDGGRNAPKRRVTLGKVGTLTPDQARDAAQKLLSSVRLGADPATARADRRATLNVRELAEGFLHSHVEAKRKVRTAANYADILNRIVIPRLGSAKVDALKRADLARLHLTLQDTPFQANRVLAVVGSMYSYGAKVGLVPEGYNPARGIERYPEEGRERFLTTDELERLGAAIRAAETIGLPWKESLAKPGSKHLPKDPNARRRIISVEAAAALRLLIFTGARLREILNLRWKEVDLERGLLLLPDSKTGRKAIILNAPALGVLTGLERISEYVIPGDRPDRPRTDLKRPWAMISDHAGLSSVRLHDLRHTFASFGAAGGLGLPIIGKLLGHANAATTQKYAHLGADPLRRASDSVAGAIAAAMGETSPHSKDNVRHLSKGRG